MSLREKLLKFKDKVLDVLFPNDIKCIFCGEELNNKSENSTCASCIKILPFISRPCAKCGGEMGESETGVCINCKMTEHAIVRARSVFNYVDDVVGVVHRLKYGGKHYLAKPMSMYMSQALATWDVEPDFVTDVPLHSKREKARGYNQSRLLAENIAQKFNLPMVEFCDKIVDNPSQTQLGYSDRRMNVKGVYKFKSDLKRKVKGKKVLIVDDIYTTGATTDELAEVLTNAGAKEVYVLTFAHAVADKSNI